MSNNQDQGNGEPFTVTEAKTGGCFRRAGAVLAFLSSALGTGLINEATVSQAPDKRWWVEVSVPDLRLVPLIWTCGGRPYTRHRDEWVGLTLSGEIPAVGEERQTLDVSCWPVVELGHLITGTTMKPGRYHGLKRMAVLVPGALGRWVLSRATALGLEVVITPVMMSSLSEVETESRAALLLYLSVGDRSTHIPAALVYSLTRLPYLIAADSWGSERLLVDVRSRSPLPVYILDTMVPQNQIWVLGPVETGCWRLTLSGKEVDGALLLAAPEIPLTTMTVPASGSRLPEPIPVQLQACPTLQRRVDGVLLDDQELEWLRIFLPGQFPEELYFLLLGDGYHLLVSPGGLPGVGIPFGIPLTRIGPGGLYVESGMDFYPPLPDSARITCFQLEEGTATVFIHSRGFRFLIEHMVPVWVLWVGPAPDIHQGLSPGGRHLLSRVSKRIRQEEVRGPAKQVIEAETKPVSRRERVKLLEQAQREELKGDLIKAAEMLEAAGYSGQAGRLYERAAEKIKE